jgi:hypothetical protein
MEVSDQLHFWPFYFRRKELGGSRNHYGPNEEQKNHLLLSRIELRFLMLSDTSLVTFPIEEAPVRMHKSIKKV